jgi:hypothetical protein
MNDGPIAAIVSLRRRTGANLVDAKTMVGGHPAYAKYRSGLNKTSSATWKAAVTADSEVRRILSGSDRLGPTDKMIGWTVDPVHHCAVVTVRNSKTRKYRVFKVTIN